MMLGFPTTTLSSLNNEVGNLALVPASLLRASLLPM